MHHIRHGLSGEEKNTSGGDNFELHLELADSKNIVVVFVLFFFFPRSWG